MIKKFRVLLALICLSLTLCIMSNTYSRYIAKTTSNFEVLFARWQILVNENDITTNNDTSINIVPIFEQNDNVASNTIAPSSKGYFDIEINPENVDVSFNYSISLSFDNTDIPDLLISKYAILDKNYVEGSNITYNDITNNTISGSLNYDNTDTMFKFETFTIRVYFEWYEGKTMTDSEDTEVGYKAATEDTTFSVEASIDFEQKIS